MSTLLLLGVLLHLAGLVVTFVGARLRTRIVGLALLAVGAGIALVVAPPIRSWPATVTIALTLIPLVIVAEYLRRAIVRITAPHEVTLDDDVL